MKFTKGPTTIEAQHALLVSRGMTGDEAVMKHHLRHANYYRLSAYAFTFRRFDHATKVRSDNFIEGTTFEIVLDRYRFDRKLRLLVMDAIERVEVAIRTSLAYHHAHEHGSFAYYEDINALPKLSGSKRTDFLARLFEEIDRARSHEAFLKHFYRKYGDSHTVPPIWEAMEVFSFRSILTMFENCANKVKNAVTTPFGIPSAVLSSWLLTLNAVRNVCAHHSRLWNREIGARPIIPTGTPYRDWNTPVLIKHERMFAVLTILNYCVQRVAPDDNWAARFRALFDDHPSVPIKYMGFPTNWETSPLWNVTTGAGGAPQPGEENYDR